MIITTSKIPNLWGKISKFLFNSIFRTLHGWAAVSHGCNQFLSPRNSIFIKLFDKSCGDIFSVTSIQLHGSVVPQFYSLVFLSKNDHYLKFSELVNLRLVKPHGET